MKVLNNNVIQANQVLDSLAGIYHNYGNLTNNLTNTNGDRGVTGVG